MDAAIGITLVVTIAVIGFVVSSRISEKRNKAIDDSFIVLESCKKDVVEKTAAANEAYHVLCNIVSTFGGISDLDRLGAVLNDYEQKLYERSQAYKAFCSAHDDSRAAIRNGVRVQNKWLGGADNNLYIKSLYEREDLYAELEKLPEHLIDGSEIRIRAHTLLATMKVAGLRGESHDKLKDGSDA